jgi:hypothetical protein
MNKQPDHPYHDEIEDQRPRTTPGPQANMDVMSVGVKTSPGVQPVTLTYNNDDHSYWYDGKKCSGVSTLAKIPDDTFLVDQWDRRMVGIGLSIEPEGRNLRENIALDLEDIKGINNAVNEAKRIAKAHLAADRGTQLHRVLEYILLDQEDRLLTDQQRRDAVTLKRTLDRYHLAPHDNLIEQFVFYPEDRVAGRFDAVLEKADGTIILVDLKGLALNTKLPTPNGWTTMATVKVGDQVIGADGKPCNVVAKSKVKHIGTYIVSFDDGTKIVCDREHIWSTTTTLDRNKARHNNTNPTPMPRSVVEIQRTLIYGNQRQHCVPLSGPFDLSYTDLRIEPYLLGAWLGDGNRGRGVISKDEDLFDILRADGNRLGRPDVKRDSNCVAYTVLGLGHLLELEELLWNKHIPTQYLRASHQQRLRLLQGLMDTDGTWNIARNRAVFNSTDKRLALGVEELLLTLGQNPHVAEYQASGFGKMVTAYYVEFTPIDITPFRLPRKAIKVCSKRVDKTSRRLIKSVEPGPDVETACIAVDSPDNTYLCSERMIPTHNSGINAVRYPQSTCVQLALYANAPQVSLNAPRSGNKQIVQEWRQMPERLDRVTAWVMLVEPDTDVGTLHPIDIEHGWRGAELALAVKDWRKDLNYGKEITWPVTPEQFVGFDPLMKEVAGRLSLEELRTTWKDAAAQGLLTPSLQAVLRERAVELERMNNAV